MLQEVLHEKESSQASKEPLSMQKIHRKVLDKGIPPDVMPGIKGVKVQTFFLSIELCLQKCMVTSLSLTTQDF